MSAWSPETGAAPKGSRLVVGATALTALLVLGLLAGGEASSFVEQSYRALPFFPLAVLAYYGVYHGWAKVLALLWLAGLVLGVAVLAVGSGAGALFGDGITAGVASVPPGGPVKIAYMGIGMLLAILIGALGFVSGVRRLVSRVLPLSPGSFVHTIALVAVITLTLESFVPLLVLGEPPLITLLSGIITGGGQLDIGSSGAVLRGELYGLVWIVPSAILAVGWGVRRDLRTALRRLGLVRPSSRQVVLGLGLGVLLVAVVAVLGLAIDWFWSLMGWRQTGGPGFDEAFGTLLAPFTTLPGAVVLGLSAGLGEELAVRGVLQPRLGILLSNLLFTSLHSFQYNWDSLVVVFVLGITLGIIRKRTNTTTSVIVHGTYDFLLVLAMMAQGPVVGQ